MAWEIILLEPVEQWFLKLAADDPKTANRVKKAIDRLAQEGPTLGRPMVDTLKHSKLANLKELRPRSTGRAEIRMLFVFDEERQAVFLVAGDKSGRWSRWYRDSIKLAERRYAEYCADQQARRR